MTYAEEIDSLVLQTLCEEPGPWQQSELVREFDDQVDAADALTRLVARGLALRMKGGFVIASASGRYAHAVGAERG